MDNLEELKKKLSEHPSIKYLKDLAGINAKLVGGAVIDILEGREPKDYDFIGSSKDKFLKEGFIFSGETTTAVTLIKDNFIVQLLKTVPENFDFTISQSKYNIQRDLLEIDLLSFETKTLLPAENSFKVQARALNSLQRIPHWRKKGYKIHDTTYWCLLGVATKQKEYSHNHSS